MMAEGSTIEEPTLECTVLPCLLLLRLGLPTPEAARVFQTGRPAIHDSAQEARVCPARLALGRQRPAVPQHEGLLCEIVA